MGFASPTGADAGAEARYPGPPEDVGFDGLALLLPDCCGAAPFDGTELPRTTGPAIAATFSFFSLIFSSSIFFLSCVSLSACDIGLLLPAKPSTFLLLMADPLSCFGAFPVADMTGLALVAPPRRNDEYDGRLPLLSLPLLLLPLLLSLFGPVVDTDDGRDSPTVAKGHID